MKKEIKIKKGCFRNLTHKSLEKSQSFPPETIVLTWMPKQLGSRGAFDLVKNEMIGKKKATFAGKAILGHFLRDGKRLCRGTEGLSNPS